MLIGLRYLSKSTNPSPIFVNAFSTIFVLPSVLGEIPQKERRKKKKERRKKEERKKKEEERKKKLCCGSC